MSGRLYHGGTSLTSLHWDPRRAFSSTTEGDDVDEGSMAGAYTRSGFSSI
jgi:hypothetical protein